MNKVIGVQTLVLADKMTYGKTGCSPEKMLHKLQRKKGKGSDHPSLKDYLGFRTYCWIADVKVMNLIRSIRESHFLDNES